MLKLTKSIRHFAKPKRAARLSSYSQNPTTEELVELEEQRKYEEYRDSTGPGGIKDGMVDKEERQDQSS